jgi:formamidopyrimidine-DNA glycosylase
MNTYYCVHFLNMPELPEVETTVRGLQKRIIGKTISDFWSEHKKAIKNPKTFDSFKKGIIGEKIKEIKRIGKNIIIYLSSGKVLLIHQKMTGHLLVGKWELKKGKFFSKSKYFEDRYNQYIHHMFYFKDGAMMAFSDLRKFAKIELYAEKEFEKASVNSLGPDPFTEAFNVKYLKEAFSKKRSPIKKVLMEQEIIAGIGNIYSDEILWETKINPLKVASELTEENLKDIIKATRKILKKGIESGGDSFSDYRNVDGEKGSFENFKKAYQRQNQKCLRCKKDNIKKLKVGGRSAHFCPTCQK